LRANLRIGVGIFIIISNFLLIVGLLKSSGHARSAISRPNKLMILLSCNDLVIGLLSLVPIYRVFSRNDGENGGVACYFKMFYDACSSFGLVFSMEIFLDIALLRCISVMRPFYRMPNKVLALIILVEVIFSSTHFIFTYLIYFHKVSNTQVGWMEIGNSVYMFCVVILFSATTFVAYCYLRTSTKEGKRQDTRQSRKNKSSAIHTLVIITLFYIICMVPLGAKNMMHGYKLLSLRRVGDFSVVLEMINTVDYIALVLLAVSNSGINSLIFLVRSKEITAYYKNLVCKLFLKN